MVGQVVPWQVDYVRCGQLSGQLSAFFLDLSNPRDCQVSVSRCSWLMAADGCWLSWLHGAIVPCQEPRV